MGKKELRKKYKDYDESVIDYVSRFDKSKTNKLTGFLMSRLSENISKNKFLTNHWVREHFNPKNQFENIVCDLLVDMLGGRENIELIESFTEHLDAGRISKNDISKYKSWDEIRQSVAEAELKYINKEMKKQTKVIFEDSTWLVLKPLSLKASQIYGMGTKWCTSMKHEESYFFNYSRRGILVYAINKKTGRKFGFFSAPDEFSVWDAVDRRIDSMETRIPSNIIDMIRVETDLDTIPVNEKLFGEESMKEVEAFFSRGDKKIAMNEPVLMVNANMGDINVTNQTEAVEWVGDMSEDVAEESMEEVLDEMILPEPVNVLHETIGEYADESADELVEPNNEEWTPRSADTAFGNFGMEVGQHVEMEIPQDMPTMQVTAEEVMEAPAYTALEIINDSDAELSEEAGN